ncbi:TDP-N-acetylfucosamine:lipid II N-acetylfucosaminyltransferase [Rossellomorea aquimaris]|uniref:TDP-N-acetylfucosamine:lipid II N-acetylfucosaminyltransferase n=1 Tax=Rossellomorea aquimaris TaxID=189382 RepID=UPI001CD58E2D|nr:TDP-N-acetylfucosamine:lipid II N-acetylfucosaminyltransferase [Rossellomorea aquimaris]MCA1060854.1 TDP-N-acetylfucosamine:lipid II N-acetylfucosaminyltransferase [Rossellomorea aquimaris]
MKHLHVSHNDKFINSYIELVNNNFNESEHFFLILGKGMGGSVVTNNNTIHAKAPISSLMHLIKALYRSEKIYLHGLFIPQIVVLLFLQPWLLSKCNWVIWGGDLYQYCNEKKTLKAKLYEKMRSFTIRNISGLITHIKGDYELAKSWYNAKGDHYYTFLYPSNLYKKYDISKISKNSEKTYIQIGNSADPTNNHIEIFNELKEVKGLKNKNFEIICPLSYGNKEYANTVLEKGKELFGDKFKPLMEFVPFENYLDILAKIDIAIFNHQRQQAVGNITTLLSLEKKVYIRDDITTWSFCEEHGLKVYSINEEFQNLFEPIPASVKLINKNKMIEQFSFEKLVNDWKIIFERE